MSDIERYELGDAFFQAGPSTFYRARNAILGNEVMVRRLTIDPDRAEDVRATFFREQRLSASLSHPNIQRPLDVFDADGYLWSVHEMQELMATEYVVAERGPYPTPEAARLGAQVADALAHMHARGFVHGRISPRTVLMGPRRDAMVINLVKSADLAAGIWPLRAPVLGLTPFSAPEEFAGERPTERSDVYGLAATVLHWLTARWPFGGETPEEALARAREGGTLVDVRELRADVPQTLVERLRGALERDPASRRGSVASLGSLLTEIHQLSVAEIPSGFHVGARLEPAGSLGRIEVLARHGAGAFGVVLRARQPGGQVDYAVKALKPEHRDDQNAYERFLREARALQRIRHPNVVRIRGVGEENGTPYAVMDFIHGPDLATVLLRDGTLEPRRAALLAAGIAEGLGAIHAEGVVHRDLKPHNILLEHDERPVIADFGVAGGTARTQLTMTGHFVGTPAYMAPEQFGDGASTPGVDLYALGAMLYEMLIGHVPYPGRDTIETIRAIQSASPTPLPDDVPVELRAVIEQLMAKDPGHRPTSAGEAAHLLREATAGLAAR